MLKFKGKETPISLYKFYLHDALVPYVEDLKNVLGLKSNSDLFTRLIVHTHTEIKQFQEWQEQKEKEEPTPESKL